MAMFIPWPCQMPPSSSSDRRNLIDRGIPKARKPQLLLRRIFDRQKEAVDVQLHRRRPRSVERERPHQLEFGPLDYLAKIPIRGGRIPCDFPLDHEPPATA